MKSLPDWSLRWTLLLTECLGRKKLAIGCSWLSMLRFNLCLQPVHQRGLYTCCGVFFLPVFLLHIQLTYVLLQFWDIEARRWYFLGVLGCISPLAKGHGEMI